MYREMLEEFEALSKQASSEDLESLAGNVILGLEKMAADEDDGGIPAPLVGTGIVAGTVAGGLGAASIARKIPEMQANKAMNKYVAASNKKNLADAKYNQTKLEAAAKLKNMYGAMGVTPGPGVVGLGLENITPEAKTNNFINNKAMKDPSNRVTTEIEGKARKTTEVAGDINALKTSDWLKKNKGKLLVGGLAAGLIAKQENDKKQKDAELQGAYGVAGVRR